MILTLVLGDIQIPYYLWINPDALNALYAIFLRGIRYMPCSDSSLALQLLSGYGG